MKLVEDKGCSIVDCSGDANLKRKKIIATTNQCVDECTGGYAFLYENKCYFKCPKGTNPDNFICKTSSIGGIDTKITENWDIKNYLLGGDRLPLYDEKQKRKFIDKTVNKMLRNELYDIMSEVIDNKKDYIIREENEVYHIYSLKNTNRKNNLTYIDFGECAFRLKEYYGITNEDDLLVFKIEYTSPNFRIPIIEYALFGFYGTKRLNLFICNGLKINYFIPKTINNYKEYIYNPENKYYNDQCYPTISNNIVDLTLNERMSLFNEKNMSLCESMCTFKGYEYNNIICECRMKFKFNSFLNIKSNKYKLIYRFEEIESNNLNFWVLNCLLNLFTKDVIIGNICSIIILGILSITFIGTIVFCIKEHTLLNNKIYMFSESILKKDNISIFSNKIRNNSLKKNKINNNQINFHRSNQSESTSRMINQNNNIINQQSSRISIFKTKLLKVMKKKEYFQYTDNELNYLSYLDSILLDKRSFFQIYFSLIRTKQILIFTLSCKNDFNPRTMKISFMFSIFALFLTFNTIFVTESTIHNLFISNGKISIFSNLTKIGLSIFISGTIKNILLLVAFPEKDIIKIRKIKNMHKINRAKKNAISIVIIRCYIFYFINIIILCLFWLYLASFFTIFKNTQTYVLINTFISFGVSMIAPFILYLIPSLIRKISIKDNGNQCRQFLYIISTILQVIF